MISNGQNIAHIEAELEGVSRTLRAKWKQAFDQFDHNKNGFIDYNELTQVMQSMRMIPAHGEVEGMIAAVDHNMDQLIDFHEFELMMVSSGRGRVGSSVGFSHIVERQIRITEVADCITKECQSFMENFCKQHANAFLDLPPAGTDLSKVENSPAWFDMHKQFQEELELMIQNLMMLWGVASQQHFSEDFIEACLRTDLQACLLQSDFPSFLQQMSSVVETIKAGGEIDDGAPMTHQHSQRMHSKALSRLAQVDAELASLDKKRNELLGERRRLIGCEVQLNTTSALRREMENRRYKDEVGMD
mmetsp:Transcript_58731/g.139950  ORF Transcript_58731/g.139950 Transcript_58731/m.139950 type:complete len:303 (+) Transcript_58731:122-1030(+)|eukprot:CAMPEP_0178411860 /NCGR_PEP_ID=MMETSP0689_2-20121128/21712_1 /TAXON_ID=160604 /ORGANISM="Amphidinium massartii, Strain CS-259" /LENGTH=302 /DNA_ID=CAMNT_0020033079 /DNA_START=120 /DNA_END=1028 /DNA_ORIENTATION=-